jgi:intracellular septation protein A
MTPDERNNAPIPAGDTRPRPRVSAWALMLGSGPRFARDAFGPVLVFYAGWKLVGFRAAILAATVLAIAAYVWERRQARSGITAGIGLGIALVQAIAGLAAGSTTAYFAPPIIVNGAYGLAFLVSVAIGRPLAGIFAKETYAFPPQVRASHTFRRVFSRISLVWGVYLLLRTGLRFFALLRSSVELYLVINVVTGIPFTAALMSWSIWYSVRSFRQSEEWGPFLNDR